MTLFRATVDTTRLADVGIADEGPVDYTDYPKWKPSLGFSQRGCRLKCPFCVVPKKEGAISAGRSINDIWRGVHPGIKRCNGAGYGRFGADTTLCSVDEPLRGAPTANQVTKRGGAC